MSFHSGKQGKVTAGGVDLPIVQWSGQFRSEKIDVTHSGSGGYAQFIAGVLQADIVFEALWDDASLPNALPPNLIEGQTVSVSLHCAGTGKTFAGSLFIEQMRYDSTVKGRVSYRCTGSFTGSYTRPA